MLERIVKHEPDRFSRCRTCGAEPHHVTAAGRSSREPMTLTVCALRHSIECRCGARTARHESLEAAEREWGTHYAQLVLPLDVARTRRRLRRGGVA